MKPFLLLIVLLPVAAIAYAQKMPDSIRLYKDKLQELTLKRGGLANATFSHATAKGNVYLLSPDNMPCLTPRTNSIAPMPNGFRGGTVDDKMNAFPKQRIIPQPGNDGFLLRDSVYWDKKRAPGNK